MAEGKSKEKIVLEKNKVLIGCTGSVASIKVPRIVEQLLSSKYNIEVEVVCTENSTTFFNPSSLPVKVYRDSDEWQMWQKIGDPVLHIELRRWADLFAITPLDANTLAKLACGMCDNLLTCVARAWDNQRPLLYAAAMNTHMWDHPLTSQHISILRGLGYQDIPCIEKKLACGDTGYGAMAEVPNIVSRIVQELERINNIS